MGANERVRILKNISIKQSLSTFMLSGHSFDKETFVNIIENLDVNVRQLKTLELVRCSISEGHVSQLKRLRVSHNAVLDFSTNSLRDAGAFELVRLLTDPPGNNQGISLALRYNAVTGVGAEKILKQISNDIGVVRKLDLSLNSIGDPNKETLKAQAQASSVEIIL